MQGLTKLYCWGVWIGSVDFDREEEFHTFSARGYCMVVVVIELVHREFGREFGEGFARS